MRKRIFGKKLKRTTNQRKALFKSLAQALFLHGRIKTTEAKAKSVKGEVEKLITIAKKHETNAPQFLQRSVPQKTAEAIIKIAPVFKDRAGGYTRIIKIGARTKDNAPMVILELVEKLPETTILDEKKEKKTVKKAKKTVEKTVSKKKSNK